MIIKPEEYQHLLDTIRAHERRIEILVGLLVGPNSKVGSDRYPPDAICGACGRTNYGHDLRHTFVPVKAGE